ncbi:MAG: hypothetical protein CENE_00046 [Candidatus Celerinatantimonas neptuna]|nr:MAG: hypothetical protein CENE_00046 [Candidatus Celerinatantimonas neptuna]
MNRLTEGYRRFLLKLEEQAAELGDYSQRQLNHIVDQTERYFKAAGDLTRDEWALIAESVRQDLQNWRSQESHLDDSPGWRYLKDSCWRWLVRMSDTTQVEWRQARDELSHQGTYHCGDYIGLGALECTQCGNIRQFWQPEIIDACPHCGGQSFYRRPLDLTKPY